MCSIMFIPMISPWRLVAEKCHQHRFVSVIRQQHGSLCDPRAALQCGLHFLQLHTLSAYLHLMP